jgi:pSer/pThr/pTyr-binding forkhead associated (FHA) protein
VADQGSSNGTWLDGRRLAPGFAYLLAATADVKLGELVVQVSLED